MTQLSKVERLQRARAWLGAAVAVLGLALVLPWAAQQRSEKLLEGADARTLDESAKVLDSLVTHQRDLLAATVGVLSEDSRVRAMVLTPTFDRATVLDLLSDLKATSGASVVAMLDAAGVVRAVVGAPEMDQLDLGTSALVKEGRERPAARLWAFANEVGVLSAAPVRLDQQVQALFMLGFALQDSILRDIQHALGAASAVFVGDEIVASASNDPELEGALRAAAELPPGEYRVLGGRFLARSSPLKDSASAARVAWLLLPERRASHGVLAQGFLWLPALLVALVVALMIGLVLSRSASLVD
jgi:hypothetical protein